MKLPCNYLLSEGSDIGSTVSIDDRTYQRGTALGTDPLTRHGSKQQAASAMNLEAIAPDHSQLNTTTSNPLARTNDALKYHPLFSITVLHLTAHNVPTHLKRTRTSRRKVSGPPPRHSSLNNTTIRLKSPLLGL